MKEEKKQTQENKPDRTRLKMTMAILTLTALFIVELYLMINYSELYLLLGIIGLAMLCIVYVLIDFSFKLQNKGEIERSSEYENLYKAQKVSYVSMKQSFLDVERTLDRIRENSEVPTEELIQAQKAVGKVTIQRNKENARAIINSNQDLLNQVGVFDQKIQELVQMLDKPDNEMEIISNQQKMIETLEGLSASVKEEISALSSDLDAKMVHVKDEIMQELEQKSLLVEQSFEKLEQESIKQAAIVQPEALQDISTEPVVTEEQILREEATATEEQILQEEPAATEEQMLQEEPIAADDEVNISESIPVESQMSAEESVFLESNISIQEPKEPEMPQSEAVVEEAIQPEFMEVAEEAVPTEDNISIEEPKEPEMPQSEAVVEEIIQPELMEVAEEAVPTEDNISIEEPKEPEMPQSEAVVEEIIQPELMEVAEEAVPIDDIVQTEEKSEPENTMDTSKSMTPDDIAALLSELNETVSEPEPVKTIETSIPDTSDPGHVMTPDEIAALLANL
jgi:Ca2+/Na+ antiporter